MAGTKQSPLRILRIHSGMTSSAFAAAAGVSVPQLYTVERGDAPLPRRMVKALDRAGLDGAELAIQQQRWREEREVEAGEILRQRIGAAGG